MRGAWSVGLWWIAACSWVSPSEIDEKIGLLDDDEDGTANALDCAPEDALQGAAGAVELPYDGLDNDCVDGDLLDVDGDGWPGVERAAWERLVLAHLGELTWPEGLRDDALDCDDQDAAVYPGAPDAPYDGRHTDCDTDNDFDRDGDGYVSADWQDTTDYATYLLAYPAAASWRTGDCNDALASIRPDADDPPYDGVDADCGYDNDFDVDQDGWVATDPTGAIDYWAAFTAYRARPGYEALTGQPGDCLDQPLAVPGALAVLGPSACEGSEALVDAAGVVDATLVYPGGCDLPYDGIDADCAGDNDFDVDRDGYSSDAHADALRTYIDAWGTTQLDPLAALDCDDRNPEVHPDALEILGDGLDQDCFTGGALGVCLWGNRGDCLARPRTSELVWTGAGRPSLAAQPDAYVLSLHTDAVSLPGAAFNLTTPAWVSLSLDRDTPELTPTLDLNGPSWWRPVGGGTLLDRLRTFTDGSTLWVASARQSGSSTADLLLAPLLWTPLATPPYTAQTARQLSVASTSAGQRADVDTWTEPSTGRRWVITCSPDELLVMTLPPDDPNQPRRATSADGGSSCALVQDSVGLAVASCGAAGCTATRLSAVGTNPPQLTTAPTLPWHLRAFSEVRAHHNADLDDAVTLFLDGQGGASYLVSALSPVAPRVRTPPLGPWPLLTTWDVQTADVAAYDGRLYVPFIGSDGARDDLFLAILEPDFNRTSVVSFALPDLLGGAVPEQVSAVVDADRLVLAVVSRDGAQHLVSWLSYGL